MSMDIALIHWPAEEARRSRLASRSQPRLLLVAGTAEPPTSADLLEDWVRLPVDDTDVRARVRSLELRIRAHQPPSPMVSGGVLRMGAKVATLTPLQSRLIEPLVAGVATVVTRDQLVRAGWPDHRPARNTVDVHMARLRKRLEPLGLTLLTIRSRGFLLKPSGE